MVGNQFLGRVKGVAGFWALLTMKLRVDFSWGCCAIFLGGVLGFGGGGGIDGNFYGVVKF